MISFAIGELGMPTLESVYNMTWAEFQIRLFAYNRMEQNQWFKIRELAWSATIAPHLNPKKMPKSKDAFMNLGSTNTSKSGVSQAQKDAFLAAYQQYQKEANHVKN